MIPVISQLPGQVSTVVLLALLILAFIVAFKVMKMVFQTILVSVLSGIFYIALSLMFFNTTPSINDVLMFAFLGSMLYMGYSFLVSAYGLASSLLSIPYYILRFMMKPFTWMYSEIKEEWKLKRLRKKVESQSTTQDFSPKDKNTKDVVLDKVRNKDKEDN